MEIKPVEIIISSNGCIKTNINPLYGNITIIKDISDDEAVILQTNDKKPIITLKETDNKADIKLTDCRLTIKTKAADIPFEDIEEYLKTVKKLKTVKLETTFNLNDIYINITYFSSVPFFNVFINDNSSQMMITAKNIILDKETNDKLQILFK